MEYFGIDADAVLHVPGQTFEVTRFFLDSFPEELKVRMQKLSNQDQLQELPWGASHGPGSAISAE